MGRHLPDIWGESGVAADHDAWDYRLDGTDTQDGETRGCGGNAGRLPCAILVANRTRTVRNGQLNRYDEQTITFDEPLRLLSGYYSALGAGSCSVGLRAMAYTDGAATSRRPREHTAAKNSWGSRPPYLKRR